MSIKTYRAKTMREAIELVRADLGVEASVLHTRELNRGLLSRLLRGRMIEVAASAELQAPSRFPAPAPTPVMAATPTPTPTHAPVLELDYRDRYREAVRLQYSPELDELQDRVKQIYHGEDPSRTSDLSDAFFHVFTDLIDVGINEQIARQLLQSTRDAVQSSGLAQDSDAIRSTLYQLVEDLLPVTGGIRVSEGRTRRVALVGPTGVGKTTTIAKLAANFRLRERRRVGLVTVDTYRVAAVEQLRTYADIIDLPMEVVSTPREMREAITRMSDMDLVLIDTAGRSPRDEIKIQELKSLLNEARADEVHLVQSCTASDDHLIATAQQFAPAGVTAVLYTKLDEATSLGRLLPATERSGLPISYLTDGQNVPDDIQIADSAKLAERIFEGER